MRYSVFYRIQNRYKFFDRFCKRYIKITDASLHESMVDTNEELMELIVKMILDNERYFCKYYIYGQKKEKAPTIEFLNIEQVGNYFPFEEINDEVYEDIPFGIAINFITFDLKRFSYILIIS